MTGGTGAEDYVCPQCGEPYRRDDPATEPCERCGRCPRCAPDYELRGDHVCSDCHTDATPWPHP